MNCEKVKNLPINIYEYGCLAKVLALDPKRVKISPKIIDCVFISYAHSNSAY